MFLNCSPVVLTVPVKICRKCGEAKPFDEFHKNNARADGHQSTCKSCWAIYDKAWHDANKERHSSNVKAWYRNNTEQAKALNKAWYEEHKERKAVVANQWRENNPDKVRAKNTRRRTRNQNGAGDVSGNDIAAIRAAQTDKQGRLICWRCCKPITGKPHLDHWIPLAKGGTNDPGNLHYMHAKCNLSKGAKLPHEIGRLI